MQIRITPPGGRMTSAAAYNCPAAVDVPQCLHPALRDTGVADRLLGRGRRAQSDTRRVSSGLPGCQSGAGMRSYRVKQPCGGAGSVDPFREVQVTEVDDSVTGLIRAWSDGDAIAGDRLFSRVYDELRSIARRVHRRTGSGADDTLDTTALVHEVYMRLAGPGELTVQNRGHFFAVAVRAARQVISNYARNAHALKRGGSVIAEPIHLVAAPQLSAAAPDDLAERVSALEAALLQLERVHPRPCRVVECRYFGGLSIPETALALDMSEATVKRDWAVAQAWLHRALREPGAPDAR